MSEDRYEIRILIGPCTEDEAENMLDVVAAYVYGLADTLGAAVAMSSVEEES